LQQKHHVKTVDELIALRNSLEAKIIAVSSNEEEILHLKKLMEQKKRKSKIWLFSYLLNARLLPRILSHVLYGSFYYWECLIQSLKLIYHFCRLLDRMEWTS